MVIWKLNLPGYEPEMEQILLVPPPTYLDEVTRRLPGGAYTTLRTYQGAHVLRLGDHLHRLEESARLANCPVPIEANDIRRAMRQALRDLGPEGDARFRITLDLQQQPGAVFVAVEVLHTPPPAAYRQGVRVTTVNLSRRNPQAKLTDFIQRTATLRNCLPAESNEALLVDPQGNILEGLSSNFFAIRDGIIWTAGSGILIGITRALVLDEVLLAGLPLHLGTIRLAELGLFQEAFITSVSRGVLPVVAINELSIGPGIPGPVTGLLMARYAARLEHELERL